MMEFMLLAPLWLPLLLGTLWIGSAMVWELEITEVARDAASLYSRGTDFSIAAGANSDVAADNAILPNLAVDLGTVGTSGNGVFIFSTVLYVGNSVCAGIDSTYGTAGTPGSHTNLCKNWGKFVFTQQYKVGNAGKLTSHFGTAPSGDLDATNSYKVDDAKTYVGDTADVSTFSLVPAPTEMGSDGYQSGQPIYLVEVYFTNRAEPGYTQGANYAYAVY